MERLAHPHTLCEPPGELVLLTKKSANSLPLAHNPSLPLQDNLNWFPGPQCAAFRNTLKYAEEKLLRFNVMTFAPPTATQITVRA